MNVTVLLFASYADAFGRDRVELTLPADARARDVVAELTRLPTSGPLPPEPLVAVNQRYAAPDQPIAPDDEIAIIPPVAGG